MKKIVGIGNSAAQKAKALGASKATCSRIRTGKQDFYNPAYHRREITSNVLSGDPTTLRAAAFRGAKYYNVSDFDADDIAQEAIMRMFGEEFSCPEHAERFAYNSGKYKARDFRRRKEAEFQDFSSGEPQVSAYLKYYPYFDQESAQMILDRAADGSDLYMAFRSMRKSQLANTCQRCGSDKNWTFHHIIPRRHDGGNSIENTAGLCRHCHDEIEFVYGVAEAIVGKQNLGEKYRDLYRTWRKCGSKQTLTKFKEKKNHVEEKPVRRNQPT